MYGVEAHVLDLYSLQTVMDCVVKLAPERDSDALEDLRMRPCGCHRNA